MNTLHVGFDAQILRRQRLGGISRYFADLSNQLTSSGLRVSSEDPSLLSRLRHRDWRHVDLVHATFYGGSPYRLKSCQRLISSLFDMTPEKYPEYFPFSKYRSPHANKREWLLASDAIISISAASSDDLNFYLAGKLPPVRVIHLATSINLVEPKSFRQLLQRRFWLMIGKRYSYKNAAVLFRSLATLYRDASPSLSLPLMVFVGGGPWSKAEQRWIAEHHLEHAVLQVNVGDGELTWLYQNAEAVFVPSLAEGFSLPLIEALICDTPVVASDIEAHREVSDSFATLISPCSTVLWAECLREYALRPPVTPSQVLGRDGFVDLCDYYSMNRMTCEHISCYQGLF